MPGLTVTLQLAVLPFAVALIVQVPALLTVIFPFLTMAILVSLLLHFTVLLLPLTVALIVLPCPSNSVIELLLREMLLADTGK